MRRSLRRVYSLKQTCCNTVATRMYGYPDTLRGNTKDRYAHIQKNQHGNLSI